MANNTDLYNINVIGTPVKPVQAIYVNQLVVKETISYAGMTLTGDPPTEVKSGINFNSGTGKIEFNSNISTAITFDSTITATGLITANGGITLGANMTTGSNWIRGSGANVGMKFTGGNVEFSGTLKAVGTITAESTIVTTGYINCGDYIVSTNSITSGGYVKCDATAEFRRGTDLGMTGTIDTATTPSIVVKGGIIISAS